MQERKSWFVPVFFVGVLLLALFMQNGGAKAYAQTVKSTSSLSVVSSPMTVLSQVATKPVSHRSFTSAATQKTQKCKNTSATANWWGVTVFLAHCAISGLHNVTGITTAAGGLAAVLDAFGVGVPIAVAAGILNIYAGVLTKEDYDCGNKGAYLNVTWLIVPWVAPVC